jgi:hypothetical protein
MCTNEIKSEHVKTLAWCEFMCASNDNSLLKAKDEKCRKPYYTRV